MGDAGDWEGESRGFRCTVCATFSSDLNSQGDRKPVRHHEGNGIHRHQDDDDLRGRSEGQIQEYGAVLDKIDVEVV